MMNWPLARDTLDVGVIGVGALGLIALCQPTVSVMSEPAGAWLSSNSTSRTRPHSRAKSGYWVREATI